MERRIIISGFQYAGILSKISTISADVSTCPFLASLMGSGAVGCFKTSRYAQGIPKILTLPGGEPAFSPVHPVRHWGGANVVPNKLHQVHWSRVCVSRR